MVKTNHFSFKLVALLVLQAFVLSPSIAQKSKYWIYLKDKHYNSYSLDEPHKFLTNKALERRLKQKISLKERDLPVSQTYLTQLQIQGAEIWYTSKWLNSVLVEAEPATITLIEQLPFVKAPAQNLTKGKKNSSRNNSPAQVPMPTQIGEPNSLTIETTKDYGYALNQTTMLGIDQMHKQGYKGQDMTIAVFDAGFLNVHKLSTLKHLFDNKRILGTYNFVERHANVYAIGDHGTKVLSTIAAYKKGEMIGSAPEANFYLFRTEDEFTEYKDEEVYWLAAAERADSLGVDVINSSLGYTTFDDESLNYTYKDLNGKTSIVAQAANIAADCGILVLSSAGNEGDSPWQYIATPADAEGIIAVGAVDKNGQKANFSSIGNTSDKRLKPNLSALGAGASVWSPFDFATISSGTSFSSPILCGMATAFWQANPYLTNKEVIHFLQKSASQAHKPDSLLGYGIPNFVKANNLVQMQQNPIKKGFTLFPNPISGKDFLTINLSTELRGKDLNITLYNSTGNVISKTAISQAPDYYVLSNFNTLAAGMYYIEIEAAQSRSTERIILKE